jgi:aminopeptidase N
MVVNSCSVRYEIPKGFVAKQSNPLYVLLFLDNERTLQMKRIFLTFFTILIVIHTFAGGHEVRCSGHHMFGQAGIPTHVKDSALLDYDVHFYGIDLAVNDTSTYVEGSTEILVSARKQLEEVVFELATVMTVDSVLIDGEKVPAWSHGNDLVRISTVTSIRAGTQFTTKVYYHGAGGEDGFFAGISNRYDSYWGKRVTYTLSESFHALDWFACKQVLTDKADSADIYLTVADHLMAGSNGLLSGIDSLPGNRVRYRWETRYPIAFYLLSLSVSDYTDYSYYLHTQQSADSFLFQNYIYDTASYLSENKDDIDATGEMIAWYSEAFGMYPFWQEKYGHCVAPLGGGMEHQTMTTLVNFGFTLVAHELAHQWFGDHVTCASWQDIWINEGFASYAEYLALEHLVSRDEADYWMQLAHERASSEPEGSVYIPLEEATDEYRIFSYAMSYKKGAALLHMIRYELDNDSVFFETLKNFQEQFADSVATGDDFLHVLNHTSGRNFDWFFEQWYYGRGYPEFNFNWWQTTDSLYIVAEQTGSSPATPFFRTTLDIGLSLEGGEYLTLKTDYDTPYKTIGVPLNKRVLDVIPDPANWIIDISQVTQRYVTRAYFTVHPNPFNNELNIIFNTGTASREIMLTDISGHLVRRISTHSWSVSIPTHDLSPGVYLLRVLAGKDEYTAKVVRQ